jgi:hypothetical protein
MGNRQVKRPSEISELAWRLCPINHDPESDNGPIRQESGTPAWLPFRIPYPVFRIPLAIRPLHCGGISL